MFGWLLVRGKPPNDVLPGKEQGSVRGGEANKAPCHHLAGLFTQRGSDGRVCQEGCKGEGCKRSKRVGHLSEPTGALMERSVLLCGLGHDEPYDEPNSSDVLSGGRLLSGDQPLMIEMRRCNCRTHPNVSVRLSKFGLGQKWKFTDW